MKLQLCYITSEIPLQVYIRIVACFSLLALNTNIYSEGHPQNKSKYAILLILMQRIKPYTPVDSVLPMNSVEVSL